MQSFARVPCYLTNDRNLEHPCQALAMNCFFFVFFFFFFFFFLFFIGWEKEAEFSLGSDLEFLQPLNFIAQQSIQLGLWEG